jgi:hypothetical protein
MSEKPVFISSEANEEVVNYIESKGYKAVSIATANIVGEPISCHPDIMLCKMGVRDGSPVMLGDRKLLRDTYPDDAIFCAACTGKYYIHNLDITLPDHLEKAEAMAMVPVHVEQGYAKCNIVIVDEESIITSDAGVAKACREAGMDVLEVTPGHVELPGFDTGFLGGASGRLGDEIIFHGDITKHPDFDDIFTFIEGKGLTCKWFDFPLKDIGSIL